MFCVLVVNTISSLSNLVNSQVELNNIIQIELRSQELKLVLGIGTLMNHAIQHNYMKCNILDSRLLLVFLKKIQPSNFFLEY